MSSHHIVRDEQEPALLILSFPVKAQSKVLDDLLEWSPTVIIPDCLTDEALLLGLKFDVVLYRSGQADLRQKLTSQFPLKFVNADDRSWVETATHFMAESGYQAMNVLTRSVDYDVKSRFKNVQVIYYDYTFKWHQVNGIYKKWCKQGQFIKVVGAGYKILGVPLYSDRHSTYTALNDGWVTVIASQTIWLGERIT